MRYKTSRAHFADGREAQRRQFVCPSSHIWEAGGLESKCSPFLLWSLSSLGLPCCLASCESRAHPPGRTAQETDACQSVYFFFPFGFWIWFRFEPGISKNETEATFAIGRAENPRGFSNWGLTNHSFHNQDLLRAEDGSVSLCRQGNRLTGPKATEATWRLRCQDLELPKLIKMRSRPVPTPPQLWLNDPQCGSGYK